jgi:2-keto-4-pentenoate hydratase
MTMDAAPAEAATDAALEVLALSLATAEQSGVPIGPLTASRPTLTVDEAYEIQRLNIAQRVAAGASVVGRKVGLTSLAMQKQLGVDQPDYGVILDDMVVAAPAIFDTSVLIAPRVEAEFSFRLGRDIPARSVAASPLTVEELRACVDTVYLSMEVIDSRIADWKITLADTIADNASSARLVVGEGSVVTPQLFDSLPGVTLQLFCDDQLVGAGEGRAVLGDPLLGALWAVNKLGELGEDLAAGEIILAGAVHASVPLTPGSFWRVSADGFPSVSIQTAL